MMQADFAFLLTVLHAQWTCSFMQYSHHLSMHQPRCGEHWWAQCLCDVNASQLPLPSILSNLVISFGFVLSMHALAQSGCVVKMCASLS